MRRRLLLIFVALLAICVVAVATLPFWLGAAAGMAGRSRGLTFASYERVGYGRFVLKDVEFRKANVRVTASRAEAPTPVAWAWRHWRGGENPIQVERWAVEITKSEEPKPPVGERGWVPLQAQLQKIAALLDRWLPQAQTGAGVVKFPGGEVTVGSAKWQKRELVAGGVSYRGFGADVVASFAERERLQVKLNAKEHETTAALEAKGPAVKGEVTWSGQRATLEALFAKAGWLPEQAELRAAEWRVPGEKLKLGEVYAVVRGGAVVTWREQTFAADVKATSEPVKGKAAPPLTVDLRGRGDLQAFTVEALQADIPGVSARLSAPVTVERGGKLRDAGAKLVVKADLARQPWFIASGAVNGEATVVSAGDGKPVVEFDLKASNVAAKDVNLAEASGRGKLAWPRLEIASGTIVAGEGERLEWHGGWDFKAKELLATEVSGEIRRRSIARWLPAQPEFDVVGVSARASGRVEEMQHEGKLRAKDVVIRGVNPLAITAEWSGRGVGAERWQAEIAAGGSRIVATGAVSKEELRLATLDFAQGGEERLKLAAPAVVRWKPALEVPALQLRGPQGNLRVAATLGEKGKIELAAGNIVSRWFSDFLAEKGPAWQLTLLALMGTWDRGPMNFSLTAGAALEIGEGRTASVNATARGDKEGIRIEALRATEGDATVVNATGRVPITVQPGTGQFVRIDENGPLVVNATAAPNAAFWQKLEALSGVELKEPDAVAEVTGTWRQPQGRVALKAARVAVNAKKVARPLPAMEQIDVSVTGDQDGVTLETFAFKVEGQPVRARGRLPLGDGQWGVLFKDPVAVARKGADLQLELPEAEVGVFARFLPAVLAPKGKLAANVSFKNGELAGFVRLRDAASRPLGPLGVLQEVSADIELKGQTLLLRGVTAHSGGQPVTLSGTVQLPEIGKAGAGATPAQPKFDLTLKGENLPFVRQTGLLLRGDLDLKLQTPDAGPVRLSGGVRLRDSLFLADVRSFLPKGGGGPSRRPPYFSVDTPPVNTWVLAVDVSGERFLRLRTPVFSGVASARFRLGGTLGEPRAIGEVEIDEGAIRMPFARFDVQQGAVRLTEAEPYEPTIYLRGTGRRYGYDLAIEIDGKASAPNVVFNSSPALESEQVLLMVMTGSAPANETSKTAVDRFAGLGMFLGSSIFGNLGGNAGDPDRLSFSSGEKISREGEETYDVEYRLTDRWTITGEKNEFDDKIVGLKWRAFRGESKPAKPSKAPAQAKAKDNEQK